MLGNASINAPYKLCVVFCFLKVWASNFMPNEPRIKDIHQKQHYAEHKVPMLLEYARMEAQKKVHVLISLGIDGLIMMQQQCQ